MMYKTNPHMNSIKQCESGSGHQSLSFTNMSRWSLSYQLYAYSPLLFFECCRVDQACRQFFCICEQCFAHLSCLRKEKLIENIDFQVLHIHAEDGYVWYEEISPDILKFVDTIPIVELPDYRFLFNLRYLRKDNSVTQVLHEGYITFSDESCLPMLKLIVFTEIDDFFTDEDMILSVVKYSERDGYHKVFTKVYSKSSDFVLSKREIEIIKLCWQGFSSKMIAAKLNLSIHTVKNHKRNCMGKTNTHNIAELIHACIVNHWL